MQKNIDLDLNIENRLISDQKLRNSAYDIASNPKYDG